MNVAVRKYGGTSLATIEDVHRIARSTAEATRSGEPVVLVVSARGDMTDELLRLAYEVNGSPRSETAAREVDQLLATGECASAALMALALDKLGVPVVSLTGPKAGIRATGNYGSGVITSVETNHLTRLLGDGNTVVVAGFQGQNERGEVITLGRGGSDTTAVALAVALKSPVCEIYSDVAGVSTADPRLVAGARVLPRINTGVMAEMAFAGARVLYSRAVELAAMQGVELRVLHSALPGNGTLIAEREEDALLESEGAVVAIAHDFDVARVLVYSRGYQDDPAAKILAVLARNSVPADMVARSGPYEEEFRMGFTIRRTDVDKIRPELEDAVSRWGGGVRVDDSLAKVSLIGMGLLNRPEYAARMISKLSEQGIVTSWVSTSQLRSSAIVPSRQAIDAVEILHREFGLESGPDDELAGRAGQEPASVSGLAPSNGEETP